MTSLRDRFDNVTSASRLLEAMKRQSLIGGDESLASAFIVSGKLVESVSGSVLIQQGSWDHDLYFIIAGAFEITINGQRRAVRRSGVHVGELTSLKPDRPRTATVKAIEPSLTLKVSSPAAESIAAGNVNFWKRMADIVADRLDERNSLLGEANEFPRVFVISSSESLEVARSVRANLDAQHLHVHIWNRGTFSMSEYPISDLEDAIEAADFTISVIAPDDALIMRGTTTKTARDNVHLEYGISLGRIGRTRSILLVQALPDLHLPSDLAGLTTMRYRGSTSDEIKRSVAVACDEIREHIKFYAVRQDRSKR